MKLSNFRMDFHDFMESLQSSGKTLIVMAVSLVIMMGIICMAVFFLAVKGQEEVMVPNVTGKELASALIEMQVKELYPKIQLRYSNSIDEKGKILEQNPPAGSIVKAGRRINLVVSRGVVIDRVRNYVGQKIDDIKIDLQSLFTGSSRALIVLDENYTYEYNEAEEGTILWQDPSPETDIVDPVVLKVGVSKGPEHDKIKVPVLTGLTLNDMLLQMNRTKVIYEFTFREPAGTEIPGTIVSQTPVENTFVNAYSRVSAVFAFTPDEAEENPTVYGIFTETLPEYPYPIELKLEALTQDGDRFTLVSFNHIGGQLTIPYVVERGTELILSILNKEAVRYMVQ